MPGNLLSVVITATLAFGSSVAFAAEEGVDRAVEGAKNTVTSPGQIVQGIEEETAEHGAVGVVTGTVKGTVDAAGQAVKGAANLGVGVIEAVTKPLTD